MQIITLTGRVGGNAETREAGQNNVTSFNLAVDQGFGDRKATNWYRISIWGERGGKLREHIRKGDKLALTGELTIGEYNGKPSYEVRCSDIDPFFSPKGEGYSGSYHGDPATNRSGGTSQRPNPPLDIDEDESIPF